VVAVKTNFDWKIALAGALAGCVNGLFGAGGGLVLVPLLTWLSDLENDEIFPASVSIILPVCVISLLFRLPGTPNAIFQALPYLIGGILGGLCADFVAKRIPVKWLHRVLGVLILWGGVKYLW